jgi:enamine deaminase RidA (YjgF/YER057c/UK114 family)
MTDIIRHQTTQKLSRIVVHNQVVYLAGTTASTRTGDAKAQTEEILSKLDEYLASVGSDKSRLLSAQIWVADMKRDFPGMNQAWEAWIPQGTAPTRATCQAALASPEILVEIIMTAAL